MKSRPFNQSFVLCFVLLALLCQCSLFEVDEEPEVFKKDLVDADGNLSEVPVPKKRILVVRFINRSLFGGQDLAEHASIIVRDAVLNYDEFVLVSEEEIEESRGFISQFGTFDRKIILNASQSYGISGVLLGTIIDLNSQEHGDELGIFRTRYRTSSARVKLQLYDVATQKLLFSQNGEGKVSEEYTQFLGKKPTIGYTEERGKVVVEKALAQVLNLLPNQLKRIGWSGSIARISAPRIYINAGKTTGLKVGQFLKVFQKEAPVFDQMSGKLMGLAPGRFKGTLQLIDYFGKDGAVAIVHSGSDFAEGDRVELHIPKRQSPEKLSQ